jgi:hypothetical protein
MDVMAQDEKHDDLGPDPTMDLSDVEPVETTPGYKPALVVPFTSEQLSALVRIGHERGVNAIGAVQQLVAEALSERASR